MLKLWKQKRKRLSLLLFCFLFLSSCEENLSTPKVDQEASISTQENLLSEISSIKESLVELSEHIEHDEELNHDDQEHLHESGLTKGEVDILKKIHDLKVKLRGLELLLNKPSNSENLNENSNKVLLAQIKETAKETLLTEENMSANKMRTSNELIDVVQAEDSKSNWNVTIKFKRERSTKKVELASLTCEHNDNQIVCELVSIEAA